MKTNPKDLPTCSPKRTEMTIAALSSLLHKIIPNDFGWYLNFDESIFSILIYELITTGGSWQCNIEARSLRSLITKISQENWDQHRRSVWSETAGKLDAS